VLQYLNDFVRVFGAAGFAAYGSKAGSTKNSYKYTHKSHQFVPYETR